MHFTKSTVVASLYAGLVVAGSAGDRKSDKPVSTPAEATKTHESAAHKPSHAAIHKSPGAAARHHSHGAGKAKPSATVPKVKKTFTVNQVVAGHAFKAAPALAMLNTYAKFGKAKKAPKKVKSAAKEAQQTGTVVANPEAYDLAYLCPVTIGGQTLNLDFDTGSSDLWVYSSLMSVSAQQGRNIYNVTAGGVNASIMSGQSWSISYGDGSGASGVVYADQVVIGGVTATSQAVEAATSVSTQFLQDTANNGLVGLAFSTLNTVRPKQQTTFFDTVRSTLAAPVFTANLLKGQPGTYDFGFIDSTKYTGNITYAPVIASSGFWMFKMGGHQIQGRPRLYPSMGNAIADTGTSLMYLPAKIVARYWSLVPGAYLSDQVGGYIFPCSVPLPAFSIGVHGTLFAVPGVNLNYAPISYTMCFGGMQANTGMGFSILGDIFLKSVFAVFDQTQGAPRIGFATQA